MEKPEQELTEFEKIIKELKSIQRRYHFPEHESAYGTYKIMGGLIDRLLKLELERENENPAKT